MSSLAYIRNEKQIKRTDKEKDGRCMDINKLLGRKTSHQKKASDLSMENFKKDADLYNYNKSKLGRPRK
jgi:hypothetical protein